ncbi:LamG domain-containing protein [Micromonospora siamensis]|uniref:Concanavalin A-like lectin/glucanases superfamily protein n=1 Tax=Micromonospora siamensis TaxID=299152 RepID=A0A1C5I2A1_9ACTN|nr:LamG domain-containing protein [Micromonospora siamensis]SCG52402.1 Concanavalin A-like lectin/glucanases superfamily protein [Micromonospora siamensis]
MVSRRGLLGGAAVAGVASVAVGALRPAAALAEPLDTPLTPVDGPHLAQAELMVRYQRMLAAGLLTDGLVGHWPLDGAGADISGYGHDVSPGPGATWTKLRAGGELSLDGTSGAYAQVPGRVVNTLSSFTVSAWVRLAETASLTNMYTAVSQDGTTSRFLLQYDPAYGWAFKLRRPDESGFVVARTATNTAQLGVWTHLAGVFDAAANTIQLYVGGQLAGSAAVTFPAWDATAGFNIGRALFGGAYVNRFNGAIDDVRAYGRALTAAEAALIGGYTARQNNRYYTDGSSSVTWGSPADPTTWVSLARCSSFLTWVLKRSCPWATDAYFRTWFNDTIPEAADYRQAFADGTGGPHFRRITRVADLRPGDLIAIDYRGTVSGNTGHIVMVRSVKGTYSGGMNFSGETQYAVEIVDCTSDAHGMYAKGNYDLYPDTRVVEDDLRKTNFEGVGIGHMMFYASDATGEFSRYRWSVNSGTTNTHTVADRPVAAARVC